MNYEMAARSQKQSSAQLGVGMLQHKCDKCNNKKPTLQRAAAGPSPETVPLIVHEVLRSPGQPLDASTRAFMEPRFGHDFSKVRVHTDAKAADSARNVNARAYTAGQDIVFSNGQYSPHDAFGRRLLAHELVHVVQQSKSIFGFQPKIQRWGAEDHKKITEASIRKLMGFFEGFQMDPVALRLFLDYSTEMDRRAPELLFNIGGAAEKIPIVGLPFKRARGSLSDYYRRHQLRALNHGEGGLYSISKEEATKRNLKHQMNIFEKARKIFKRIPAHYASSIESERAKIQGRNSVLSLLGDALHIAQDRGAHGEGGAGLGHSRLGFDPDSKSENSTGYIEAIRNTELIILDAQDILYRLLHMNWTRTFSIIQKKEFYKKATAEPGFSIESEDSFEKEADEVAESVSTNAIKTTGLHSHAIPKIQKKIESSSSSKDGGARDRSWPKPSKRHDGTCNCDLALCWRAIQLWYVPRHFKHGFINVIDKNCQMHNLYVDPGKHGGHSHAEDKTPGWDTSGENCLSLRDINCIIVDKLISATKKYEAMDVDYSGAGLRGPNSNSFLEWILHESGIKGLKAPHPGLIAWSYYQDNPSRRSSPPRFKRKTAPNKEK